VAAYRPTLLHTFHSFCPKLSLFWLRLYPRVDLTSHILIQPYATALSCFPGCFSPKVINSCFRGCPCILKRMLTAAGWFLVGCLQQQWATTSAGPGGCRRPGAGGQWPMPRLTTCLAAGDPAVRRRAEPHLPPLGYCDVLGEREALRHAGSLQSAVVADLDKQSNSCRAKRLAPPVPIVQRACQYLA